MMIVYRCDAFCTDDLFLPNYAREDGWRCGKEKGHVNGHALYSMDGERRLPVAGWYVPKHHREVS